MQAFLLISRTQSQYVGYLHGGGLVKLTYMGDCTMLRSEFQDTLSRKVMTPRVCRKFYIFYVFFYASFTSNREWKQLFAISESKTYAHAHYPLLPAFPFRTGTDRERLIQYVSFQCGKCTIIRTYIVFN